MTDELDRLDVRPSLSREVKGSATGSSFDGVVDRQCGGNDGGTCVDPVRQGCAGCRMSHEHAELLAWRALAASHFVRLTKREREVMQAILAGHANKNVAMDLGISQRTVENHRASIMRKTGSRSLPALSRLELAATWSFDVPRREDADRPVS